jgi:hypothetical protein
VIRAAPPVVFAGALAALLAAAAPMAGAQTANSTSGNVGSASLRNGYPAGGGAIALPAPGNAIGNAVGNAAAAANPTGAAGAGTGVASGGGAASAGGAGASSGGRGSGASAGGGGRSSGAGGGGGNWVLCPPAGSSGLPPLFTGTDLSCAPD